MKNFCFRKKEKMSEFIHIQSITANRGVIDITECGYPSVAPPSVAFPTFTRTPAPPFIPKKDTSRSSLPFSDEENKELLKNYETDLTDRQIDENHKRMYLQCRTQVVKLVAKMIVDGLMTQEDAFAKYHFDRRNAEYNTIQAYNTALEHELWTEKTRKEREKDVRTHSSPIVSLPDMIAAVSKQLSVLTEQTKTLTEQTETLVKKSTALEERTNAIVKRFEELTTERKMFSEELAKVMGEIRVLQQASRKEEAPQE